MKNRGSITIFDIMARRKRMMRRCIAMLLVLVTVVTTCFTSRYTKTEAQAATTSEAPVYIEYVIDEMINHPNEHSTFVILEIVADESQAEFPFYAPSETYVGLNGEVKDGILRKFSYLTQNELLVPYLYNNGWTSFESDGTLNTYVKNQDIYVYDVDAKKNVQQTVSLLSMRTKESGFTGKVSIQVENSFLQVVLPQYYSILKDRLEVRVVEANDLTLDDIEEADLVYIHGSAQQQGDTINVNRTLSMITGKGSETDPTVGRQSKVINPTYTLNSKGEFEKTAEPKSYSFSEYEYVEVNSEEDKAYKSVLDKYKNDTATLPFLTYQTYDVKEKVNGEDTVVGYYKSRDMNWAVAQKLLEYNLIGKTFKYAKDENGNAVTATLPVILISDLISDQTSNVGRVMQLINMISSDLITDNQGKKVVYPYNLIKQCMNTDVEIYTKSGMRTAAIAYRNYGKSKDKGDDIYDYDQKVTDGTTTDGGGYMYFYNYIPDTQQQSKETFITNGIAKIYDFAGWTDDQYRKAILNTPVNVNALGDNFMGFPPSSTLVPASRNVPIGKSSDYYIAGYADRYGDDSVQYAYKMIQWILGATGSASDFVPTSTDGTPTTMALNILEIEPCNVFTYTQDTDAGRSNTVALLEDIVSEAGTTEYTYNSGSGLYEVKSSDVVNTSYQVNVDCYTVNAFNGLTADIIADYDIIYIGVNYTGFEAIKSNFASKKSWDSNYEKTISYSLYYPASGTVNSNDLTKLKVQEIKDYVEAGKILLLADKLTASTLNVTASTVDETSQVFTMMSDFDEEGYDNVVFRNNAKQIFYSYQSDCTPTLTSVTVKGATGVSGSEISYDASGLISSTVSGGLTVNFTADNCLEGKSYCVAVVVDQDNDGVYGEDESDYKTVKSYTYDSSKAIYKQNENTGNYTITDSLSVTIPDNFVSDMIQWKICIYEQDTSTSNAHKLNITDKEKTITCTVNSIKRDTYKGYTPYQQSGEAVEVNVLQIASADSEKLLKISGFENLLKAAETKLNYNVTITSYTPEDKESDGTTKSLTKDLILNGDYQMLIVGTNTYSSLEDTLKEAIQTWLTDTQYVGRRIMFVNDTNSDSSGKSVGLATLGQAETTTTGKSKNVKASTIAILNDGQMNQYPYNISDGDVSITASTNPESYQVALDFADETAQTSNGIVVWNTLTGTNSGDFYYVDYKDAINNYYMYSMGHVIYSAMGACDTDTDQKLMINAIMSKSQWKDSPSIVVNNGVMTAGGYNIYVDLEEIKDNIKLSADTKLDAVTQAAYLAEANALRQEYYIIDFTARNYDNSEEKKWMTGEIYWYPDASKPDEYVELFTYSGTKKLESEKQMEVNLTVLAPGADTTEADKTTTVHQLTADQYKLLLEQIESESVDIRIHVKNTDDLESEKKVTFKQRHIYNLK